MSLIRAADTLIVFRILRLLTIKWEDQKAFKMGIIDADGKPLKKVRELKTPEEKKESKKFFDGYEAATRTGDSTYVKAKTSNFGRALQWP